MFKWLTSVSGDPTAIVLSLPFIAAVVLSLVSWALASGWGLSTATRRICRIFESARANLLETGEAPAFTAHYEACSLSLGGLDLIGPAWRDFSETVVVPLAPGRSVRATQDPPGLLVGAGLLFTFLGLAVALSSAADVVAAGSPDGRNNALHSLLGAASIKFITSLAGLGLSIAYALFRKFCLKKAERAQEAFLSALCERLPLCTPASLQAEANILAERQYSEIQRISTDFFVNLGSTLETSFGAGLEQHIGPLAAAMEKLSAGMASQNEDAMQGMLGAFLERLEGSIGGNMRDTAATLQSLGERLGGLQSGMDEAAARMGRAAEEMATGLGRGAEQALDGITGQIQALVSQMRDMADAAGRQNREAGDDMTRQMATSSAQLAAAAEAFKLRMEEGAENQLGRLAAPVAALVDELKTLGDAQRTAGAAASEELAVTMGRAASGLEATAARIAEALGGGAADVSARLVAATEAMRDDLRDVLTRFGETLDSTGAALAQGASTGAESLRNAASGMNGDLAASAALLRDAGEAAGAALREGGASAKGGMESAAGTLVVGSRGLADTLTSLGTASSRLADGTQALDQAARAAANPLVSSAASLNEAGIAAREAARPLQAAAEALAVAASSIAGSHNQADALAQRLLGAAERFERLDGNLAATMRALAEGLDGFRRQITDFVRDIDQGLATSTGRLSAVAKELGDQIEDLTDAKGSGIRRAG